MYETRFGLFIQPIGRLVSGRLWNLKTRNLS